MINDLLDLLSSIALYKNQQITESAIRDLTGWRKRRVKRTMEYATRRGLIYTIWQDCDYYQMPYYQITNYGLDFLSAAERNPLDKFGKLN